MLYKCLAIALLILLTGCSPKLEGDGFVIIEGPAIDYEGTPYYYPEVFTNVSADWWSISGDNWNLHILQCQDWVHATYWEDGAYYEIDADDMDAAVRALSQFDCASSLTELLSSEPVHHSPKSYVTDAVDGWGSYTINGVSLPWPEDARTTAEGWQTDDATFLVLPPSEPTEVEAFTEDAIYYSDDEYQGIAIEVEGEWYVSLALYRPDVTFHLSLSAQPDLNKAKEYATKYGMQDGMNALLSSK